jgi:hypothetical protein
MVVRAATLLAFSLVLAACGFLLPSPAGPTIPIAIRNDDDKPARIEVTLYRALEQDERTVVAPFELAPGASTTLNLEATFDRDGAYHLVVNDYVAVSSEFVGCEPRPPPMRVEDLPRSVQVVVTHGGTPDACSFVEAPS